MGMDLVELDMELEDRFGIELAGDDRRRFWTVADVVAGVRAKLGGTAPACPSVAEFVLVRELVREAAGDGRLRVRPSDRLADRLTPRQRRELWRRLPDRLGGPPPRLESRGDAAVPGGLAAVVLAAPAALWVGSTFGPAAAGGVFAAVAGGASAWAGYQLTPAARVRPPWGWETAGDLARRLAVAAAARFPPPGPAGRDPGHDAVFHAVRDVLVRSFAVPPDDVAPEARLVEDLQLC